MKPVPSSVFDDNTYPDVLEYPLYRLEATCLSHWGRVVVGEPFRWVDENIRLSPTQETTFERWEEWRLFNRFASGWPRFVRLYCKVCGRRTRLVPKGAGRV